MLATIPYRRDNAVAYARRWALSRNPLFENYSGIGGDCTNFVSQSIYAGGCTMNYTPDFGWYYISPTNRAPAWTGVEFLYNFLTSNTGDGPFGIAEELTELQIGDIIQLSNENDDYFHTLFVSGFDENVPLVAAQTIDAFNRPISEYVYKTARGIHILGYRRNSQRCNCFEDLFNGTSIIECI